MATRKQGDSVEQAEQHVEQVEAKLEADQAELIKALGERAEAAQATAESGQAAVIEERIAALREAAEPDAGRVGYTVGVWAGQPHYRANDGSFDTFDEDEMRAHVRRQMV